MKIVAGFFTVVVTLLGVVYVLLFTPSGNDFVKPYIEKEIQEQIHLSSKLQNFSLGTDSLEALLLLNQNNSILLKINFSLLSQSFNAAYRLQLNDLGTLFPLTKKELQGVLHTQGKIVGNIEHFEVDGVSSVASSKSHYHIVLDALSVSSLEARVSEIDLKELLYILKEKAYVAAKLSLDINFKDIRAHHLDGKVAVRTSEGVFNARVIQEELGITIPKQTVFKLGLDAILEADDINYTYRLSSNLATMSAKGVVTPEPLSIDTSFSMNVKELALLKPLSGLDIRGDLQMNGTVVGGKKTLIVDAKTDFAESNSRVQLLLKNFQVESLKADVRGLKVQKALYMLKMPHYSDGSVDIQAMLSDLQSKKVHGKIKSSIKNGKLDTEYLSKEFTFDTPMPATNYRANTFSKLHDGYLETKVDISSTLLDLTLKQLRYTLSDGSLESDYRVLIKDLQKFYFLTSRDLKGRVLAKGRVKKAEDIDLSMKSKIAGGVVNLLLHKDTLTAKFSALESLQLLDILRYPKLFASDVDGRVKYDLKSKSGDIQAKLRDGKFTSNRSFDLVKKYAKIDMYKEKFFGDLDAKIKAQKIVSSLFLQSNTSSIKSKHAKIDMKTNTIDAIVDISANKNPIKVKLSGDINTPKVIISADELLKREATKVISKEVNRFLKNFF